MFSLFYLELMGKIEENKEKYLMACDQILVKILNKVKIIMGIEKFDDTKTLTDTDITLKNVVMLIMSIVKDGDKLFVLRTI